MAEEGSFRSLVDPLLPQFALNEEEPGTTEDMIITCELDCWGRSATRGRIGCYHLGGWRAAMFLLGAHSLQSLAISGCTVNLVIFLVKMLKQDNASAANIFTNWIGTSFLTSIIGASIGDAYMGRLWTSITCHLLFVMALLIYALYGSIIAQQSIQSCLNSSDCEANSSSTSQVAIFYAALYVMGVGSASSTPNIISLGADQFDLPKQKSLFLTLYIASSNVGMLLATTAISYVQDEGKWATGFWVSAWSGVLSFFFLLVSIPCIRQSKTGVNPLFRIVHVVFAAACNSFSHVSTITNSAKSKMPNNSIHKSTTMSWLDNAAKKVVSDEGGSSEDGWRTTCTIEQVEEVRSVLKLLPFWLCSIMVCSVTAQKSTLFLLQAATMNNKIAGTSFKFPASSMTLFSLISVVFGALLYSWVIVPCIIRRRKHENGMSPTGRMGIGLWIAVVAFCVAAIVESKRLRIAHLMIHDDESGTVPMSIFWLVPQYVLEGLTTVFYGCGHLDFNYTYSPQSMRSLVTAIFLSGMALGNYSSSLIVQVITSFTSWIPEDLNAGHLDYFYWLLDCFLLFTLALFAFFSKWHRRTLSPMDLR